MYLKNLKNKTSIKAELNIKAKLVFIMFALELKN